MDKRIKRQFKLLGLALLLIPLCWLIVALFFVFVTPQLVSDEGGLNWGQLFIGSLLLSLIPGLFTASVTYTILNAIYSKK